MKSQSSSSTEQPRAPEERTTQFVRVEGGEPPATDAGTFMVAAYLLIWLCTALFILQTWRQGRRLQQRIDELQKALTSRSPHALASPGE
jgi:hypothetical protein